MVIRKAYGGELHVIDMKGNPSATSTHEYRYLSSYVDQDGKQFTPPGLGWLCGIKDKDDNIWLGTESTGVVRITDPRKLGTAESRVERVKVPRNDGTNYADYLLESERILCMAVDHSNRKWIGTKNSGVYLVSPNGDKILEHFTTSNSILPSNCVISIFAIPPPTTSISAHASAWPRTAPHRLLPPKTTAMSTHIPIPSVPNIRAGLP